MEQAIFSFLKKGGFCMKKVLLLGFLVGTIFSCSASKYDNGLYAEFNTNKGKIVAKLFYDVVPMTVANFVGLAEGTMKTNKPQGTKIYENLVFFRVVPDFMVQCGDPLNTGTGDPGYKFPDEFSFSLRHNSPGILSMANSGPNTNGSQFFITHKATPWLDNKHSIFGKVVEGLEAVNKIVQGDTLKSVKIIRVGGDAKKFKTGQAAFDGYAKSIKDKIEQDAKKIEAENTSVIAKKWPNAIRDSSGYSYVVLAEGKGPTPTKGTPVKVHYTGTLLDGKKFDSSYDRGQPIEFPVGTGRVIRGWDAAIVSMKKGEKRTIIIPPALGYGAQGAGGVIPPNAYLVFDVELVSF
jgi:FKBP-type peptidyl-prolyl cis-trans isomerase